MFSRRTHDNDNHYGALALPSDYAATSPGEEEEEEEEEA